MSTGYHQKKLDMVFSGTKQTLVYDELVKKLSCITKLSKKKVVLFIQQ